MAISAKYQAMLINDYSPLFDAPQGKTRGVGGFTDALYNYGDFKTGAAEAGDKSSAAARQYLADVKTASTDLTNAFNALLGKNKEKLSVFNEKTPVSSNTDVLTVSVGAGFKNAFADTEITVKQAAAGQKKV